jgi:hypothetical protein
MRVKALIKNQAGIFQKTFGIIFSPSLNPFPARGGKMKMKGV